MWRWPVLRGRLAITRFALLLLCPWPSLHCHVSVVSAMCQSLILHCHVSVAQFPLPCFSLLPWVIRQFCIAMCLSLILHCHVSVCHVLYAFCIAMCQSPSLHCHVSVTQPALPCVTQSALPCVSQPACIAMCQSLILHCHVSVTQSALPCVSRPWCIANVHPEYPHCICHCLNHQCCFASRLDHQHCFVHSPIVVTWQMSALRLTGAL